MEFRVPMGKGEVTALPGKDGSDTALRSTGGRARQGCSLPPIPTPYSQLQCCLSHQLSPSTFVEEGSIMTLRGPWWALGTEEQRLHDLLPDAGH